MSDHEEILAKQYELAAVLVRAEDEAVLQSSIERAGAVLGDRTPATPVHLAYPIAKQQSGYLVSIRFSGLPDTVITLTNDLKLRPEILRFLIIAVSTKLATRTIRTTHPAEAQPSVTSPTLTNEALEEKLEEILK